jgi:Tfp pilus assembly protein PilF/TolB-like protein
MRKALFLFLLLVPLELQGAPAVRTVLVFPFENQSNRPDLNWISESFAEIISSRLSGPGKYVLAREERNATYLQVGVPPETPLTLATEIKVAQTLGVDWAVVGNFNVSEDRLTARAQLLEMRQLKLAPAIDVQGNLNELVDLQTRLAWRLLATHDPDFTVGQEEDFRRRFPELRLDAFENYIRGLLATDDDNRIHFFSESERLDPADHRAAFELGRIYFDQKDYANSSKWLGKLKENDPHYLESQFLLAVDEYFLGQQEASEKAFEALAKEIPLNEVTNNLGVLEARLGRYESALASFERAYFADPTDPDFSFNRGVALWYLKRYPEAEKSLEESIRQNGDDSEAHTLLAAIMKNQGNAAGESRELDWLAQQEQEPASSPPDDVLPLPRLKKNYDGRAFRLLAVTVQNLLEARLQGMPVRQHSAVHLERGKKFYTEGRLPEAERELGEVVSLVPQDSDARVALAQVFEAEGKHRDAAAELETSLKIKDSVAAHLALAHVYLALGHPELARDQSKAALSLDPSNQQAEQMMEQIPAGAAGSRKTP